MEKDLYHQVGACVELLSVSDYHNRVPLDYCMARLILPAIHNKQFKLYYSSKQKVQALVTWAWLTKKELKSACAPEGRGPIPLDKWNCGTFLYIADFIAPYGNVRKVILDMKNNNFPNIDKAFSVRRGMDRSVRKKSTWRNRE